MIRLLVKSENERGYVPYVKENKYIGPYKETYNNREEIIEYALNYYWCGYDFEQDIDEHILEETYTDTDGIEHKIHLMTLTFVSEEEDDFVVDDIQFYETV